MFKIISKATGEMFTVYHVELIGDEVRVLTYNEYSGWEIIVLSDDYVPLTEMSMESLASIHKVIKPKFSKPNLSFSHPNDGYDHEEKTRMIGSGLYLNNPEE